MENINDILNFSNFNQNITITSFFLKVILVSLLSYFLGLIFLKFGRSISNKADIAHTFPLLGLATMSVITVVKSSLALSLGLVGALSIVRFRTPIKEPEELIYLFLTITLGLAIGADQYLISVIILIGTYLLNLFMRKSRISKISNEGYFNLVISSEEKIDHNEIIKILKKNCALVNLKRFSGQADNSKTDICFNVILKNLSNLNNLNSELKELNSKIHIDLVDISRVGG